MVSNGSSAIPGTSDDRKRTKEVWSVEDHLRGQPASSIELYQDYGGFPLVPDARLRQWAAMLERNTGVPAR